MFNTWKALLVSRKFWVGAMTITIIAGVIYLVALKVIPVEAAAPTILAFFGVGSTMIASIAWEDSSTKKIQAAEASKPTTTQTVNLGASPELPTETARKIREALADTPAKDTPVG